MRNEDGRFDRVAQALHLIAISLTDNRRVLDVTCWEGSASASLVVGGTRPAPRTGDPAEVPGSSGMQFIEANPCHLPFVDDEFGLVVCHGAHYSDKIQLVLIEMKRVLSSDGALVISAMEGSHRYQDPSDIDEFEHQLRALFSNVRALARVEKSRLGANEPDEQQISTPVPDETISSLGRVSGSSHCYVCSNISIDPLANFSNFEPVDRDAYLSEELRKKEKEVELLKANLSWIERRQKAESVVLEAALELEKLRLTPEQRLGIQDIAQPTVILRLIANAIRHWPYSAMRAKALADPTSATGRIFFAIRRKARWLASPLLKEQTLPAPPKPKAAKPMVEKPYRPETIRLPKFAEPEVSIIIAAFNNFTKTHKCLVSVSKNTEGVPFEVILVDDASVDQTSKYFAHVENLTLLVNELNQGFLLSCNRGASAARGKYLLFLNNDTQVKPGWLAAMVEPVKSSSKVGIVGAKLLYPDQTLQEAGGIVWRDGSGFNYGRGDDPSNAEYTFQREVDYCSGACILVRLDLFEEAGGFDTRFTPAYYEDVDLAFTARELGYTVLYQPRAEVVHDEGSSHGVDTGAGLKRFQVVNQEKFASKWSSSLLGQPVKGSDLFRARQREPNGRVLIVDATVPTFDQDAGSLRMDWLLKSLLEMGFGVSLLPDNRQKTEPYTTRLQDMGIEVIYGDVDLSQRFGAAYDLKACIASRPYVAWKYLKFLRQYAPHCEVIYDTVDLHYLREQRRAQWENDNNVLAIASKYKALELALMRACAATITVTDFEKRVLLEEEPTARVHVIPTIHEINPSPKTYLDRKDLLFVGGFNHPPNRAAVLHFLKNVFPTVRAALPGIKFHIVGSNAPPDILNLACPDVIVAGFVKDLGTYLQGCRIAVAPMTFGAGLKGKITQSLSEGIPVVATAIGAEGTGIVSGRDGLIADDPEEFAQAVVKLYEDRKLWTAISESGRVLAAKKFSPDVVRTGLTNLLTDIGVRIPST